MVYIVSMVCMVGMIYIYIYGIYGNMYGRG